MDERIREEANHEISITADGRTRCIVYFAIQH
jgi:hypothetical protein